MEVKSQRRYLVSFLPSRVSTQQKKRKGRSRIAVRIVFWGTPIGTRNLKIFLRERTSPNNLDRKEKRRGSLKRDVSRRGGGIALSDFKQKKGTD